jgi:hypothetical protein
VPPYLVLELRKTLPAVFVGGEQDAPLEVRLASREEDGNLPARSYEHVTDHLQVLEPRAFGTLLQCPRIEGSLSRIQGLHKQRRIMNHPVPLRAVRLVVVFEEPGHLPGGERCLREVLREHFSVLGYRARNGDDHPRRGPRGDRPLSDERHDVIGEGVAQREAAGDPALGAAHERGDPLLRELVTVMEFLDEGGLLDELPFSAVAAGEDLSKGLFLGTVPDLGPHRVAPAVLHGPHPQVAVEEYEGGGDHHRDELADTFDGGPQREALFGPLDSRVGVAEVELADLNLPDLSMSVHDKQITRKKWSVPSCLLSPLSVSMRRKGPRANAS